MARELLQIGVTLPEFLRAFAALAPHALEYGVGEQDHALLEERVGLRLGTWYRRDPAWWPRG
jgi:hypothetical protein